MSADQGAEDIELNEATPEALEAALREAETEVSALKEQMLRVAADAENAKRRAEREANDARAYAIQKFARDLLGVADNLSRALQFAPKDESDPAVSNLVVGLEMTERELNQAFERNGLKKVNPLRGEKFDPNFHQAMMEQPAADAPAGSVLQVMQAGYELMGRIVRPAMVVVADKTSGAAMMDTEAGPKGAYGEGAADDGAGAAIDTKA